MQVHSLEIDEFEDLSYTLISVHTGVEDYKLAYLLNTKLGAFFIKSRDCLDIERGGQKAAFSVFNYEDEKQFSNWHLISNKYHGKSSTPIENGLFGTINQTVNKTSYLIPEKKQTDYLIKIEGDFDSFQVHEIIKSIKEIKQVVTSYEIDITTLKSKDFLIF